MPSLIPRRALSVALALELATTARTHWNMLTPGERAHLGDLVKKSKGRPQNLTPRDRKDLRRLVGKLDLPMLGRSLVTARTRHRR
jgi:hypothetical protein